MRITKTRTFTLKKVALALMIAAGTITSAYAVVTGSTGTIRGVIPVLKSASGADIHAVDFATNGTNPLMPVTGDTITMSKKAQKLRLIHPLDHNYYVVCRTKLGWGSRLGGGGD